MKQPTIICAGEAFNHPAGEAVVAAPAGVTGRDSHAISSAFASTTPKRAASRALVRVARTSLLRGAANCLTGANTARAGRPGVLSAVLTTSVANHSI